MPKNTCRIALIVGLILLVPLLGNFFVEGWRWGLADFIIMGLLLFITGLTIDFSMRKLDSSFSRVVAVIVIVSVLLLIWAELAVNAISQDFRSLFS